MYELTDNQALAVGGGFSRVPYHYEGQRVILPTVEIERPLGPVEYPGPPEPVPDFGG
ncbi:MAG: hypothetical protein OXP28_15255 [Gammaproteobacteria bacterium]|nr:hypothetical protein [Gammaproteobacteria bacterium]